MEKGKKETRVLKTWDLEMDLAKLLFFAKMSYLCAEDKYSKKVFKQILDIVNKWLEYYAEDKNLKRISDEESIHIHELLERISFDVFCDIKYCEYLETFIDIITYYPDCPINEEFDPSIIKRRKDTRYEERRTN